MNDQNTSQPSSSRPQSSMLPPGNYDFNQLLLDQLARLNTNIQELCIHARQQHENTTAIVGSLSKFQTAITSQLDQIHQSSSAHSSDDLDNKQPGTLRNESRHFNTSALEASMPRPPKGELMDSNVYLNRNTISLAIEGYIRRLQVSQAAIAQQLKAARLELKYACVRLTAVKGVEAQSVKENQQWNTASLQQRVCKLHRKFIRLEERIMQAEAHFIEALMGRLSEIQFQSLLSQDSSQEPEEDFVPGTTRLPKKTYDDKISRHAEKPGICITPKKPIHEVPEEEKEQQTHRQTAQLRANLPGFMTPQPKSTRNYSDSPTSRKESPNTVMRLNLRQSELEESPSHTSAETQQPQLNLPQVRPLTMKTIESMASPQSPRQKRRTSLLDPSRPEDIIKTHPHQIYVDTSFELKEKELIISISPFIEEIAENGRELTLPAAQLATSNWISSIYRGLCYQASEGYKSKRFSETNFRIYFTHSLALNVACMTEYYWRYHNEFWRSNNGSLLEHFQTSSKQALKFQLAQYPKKPKLFISEDIYNAIPVKDSSENPTYDYISNSKLQFSYDKTGKSYAKTVKTLLNNIMDETKSNLEMFKATVKELFTVGSGSSRRVLDHAANMKFKDTTPRFSAKQMQEDGIQIKSPEILRIVIKWSEELNKKIQILKRGSDNTFSVRGGQSQCLDRLMKNRLRECMKSKAASVDRAEEQMQLRIRSVLALLPEFIQKQLSTFPFIHPNDLKSGVLSYLLAQTASNLSVNYLLFLIGFLEEVAEYLKPEEGEKVRETYNREKNRTYESDVQHIHFEFVTFTISDLLRCKCSGTLVEITEVWSKLKQHQSLIVYRVKNRLEFTTKDFLINAHIKGTNLLCEIQLTITDKMGDEVDYNDHFSHFIYELSRESYGTIAGAVIINSYITEVASYFGKELNVLPKQYPPLKVRPFCDNFGLRLQGHSPCNSSITFLCANCLQLRPGNAHHLPSFESSENQGRHLGQITKEIKKTICGDCIYQTLNPQDQATWILGFPLDNFFVGKRENEPFNDKFLIAVKKARAVKKIEVLQLLETSHDSNRVYVPVFYQCSTKRYQLSQPELTKDFYLFNLRQDLLPSLRKEKVSDLESSFNETKLIVSVEYAPKSRAEIQSQYVTVVNTQEYMMVLSSYHFPQKLEKLARQSRKFKEVETELMLKTPKWCLDDSNIGDSSFSIRAFQGDLTHLEEIKATYNHLTSMRIIKGSKLKVLDLSHNSIAKLELSENYPSLDNLDLTENNINAIQDANHNKLRELYIGGNPLSIINEEVWQMPWLEHLQLCDCSITNLDLEKMNCPRLKKLDLWSNPLETINFGSNMPLLECISAKRCSLTRVDFGECPFENLKRLNLGNQLAKKDCNKITEICLPPSINRLEELLLSDNRLRIFELKSGLPSLIMLDLHSNLLESIELSVSMPSLKTLDLAHNRIRVLSISVSNLPELKLLNLSFLNQLERLNIDERHPFQNLQIINYRYNLTALNHLTTVGIEHGGLFPKLIQVLVGVHSVLLTVLWNLRRLEEYQRAEVYSSVGVDCQEFNTGDIEKALLDNGRLIEVKLKHDRILKEKVTKIMHHILELLLNSHKVMGHVEQTQRLLEDSQQ